MARDLTSNNPNHPNISSSDDNNSDLNFEASHNQSSNPFLSQNEVSNDPNQNRSLLIDQNSINSSSRYSTNSGVQPPSSSNIDNQYGKFNAYSGYYSKNGTSSHLLSHENSSSEDQITSPKHQSYLNIQNSSSLNNNNIHVPPEFDRYPSMAGSRVVSTTSLSSHLYPPQAQQLQNSQSQATSQYGDDDQSSSTSNKSASNPFLNSGGDFSPFGGYPATSFPLHIDEKEPDDYLHNPDPIADAEYDKNRFAHDFKHMDKRSIGGLIGFIVLFLGASAIFVILPALTYSGITSGYKPQAYEILTHYQYPLLSAIRTDLVDPDTPQDALTHISRNGDTWNLVFSDEFNIEGRTFYPGDDQFFTAPDLHYDATKDLEWYSPDAVTTANGTATLRMDAYQNHNLFYRSGMLQSWNQFCFTQGMIQFSARLPNYGTISGLWPGLWTMGNLGRPGYLATTEGVWPYSYEACDAGITANQSSPDGISYLPGQRLNSCTCPGQSHPNPGVGRGAPEIDAIEAEVGTLPNGESLGVASQSLQLAPMDIWYIPDYDFVEIYNLSITTMNTYAGGPFQQALSATTTLNETWYERSVDGVTNYQHYGYEFLNDDDTGYIQWFVGNDPTLTVHATALHPNGNINWRRISKEPMSIIMNLGISNNWAYINWPSINFPVTMSIDYVRVYQPANETNVGCDPADYPTAEYIAQHLNIYENVNLTSFEDGGYTFPTNKLTGC
ncbi:glucan synthase subunit [Scheffersomyces coipomensis]|uniref:glucan synthase subunit n=1 Tax=Scheffersomyces coipomensis TaxID=1788519 RepID=UPI00315D6D14